MAVLIDYRPVFRIMGSLLIGLAAAMLIPAGVDLVYNNLDWQAFAASAAASLFTGALLLVSSLGADDKLNPRQAVLLTIGCWLSVVLFAALPMTFSALHISFTDAFFEAMSGLTTTGSTVISGLDNAPPGILLWRGLLQWMGGVGIVVMGAAILPFLRIGGMQLFRLESSEQSEKIVPQFSSLIGGILKIYIGLTVAAGSVMVLTGMSLFEAVVHAMTTVSTGGFSTSDGSIGHFGKPALEWSVTVFMILGSLPFLVYLKMLQGHPREILRNPQVRSFLLILTVIVLSMAMWLWAVDHFSMSKALRLAAFNTVSIVTTTGYATGDYTQWGSFPVGLIFMITVIGGCTGSTAGGIKIYRLELLWISLRNNLKVLIRPHSMSVPHYGGQPLSQEVMAAGVLYIGVFLGSTAIISVILHMMGLDLITGVTATATAIANVGPGLGNIIGPSGNFQALPDGVKWVLAFAMLLGRLEVFAVLVVFTPSFWRW